MPNAPVTVPERPIRHRLALIAALDTEGNINIESDLYVKSAVKEATLTQDLSGLGASLDRMFNVMPFTKPFFLFALR